MHVSVKAERLVEFMSGWNKSNMAMVVKTCKYTVSKSNFFDIQVPGKNITFQIASFMALTWGAPGSCRSQVGPILVPWTLLSGLAFHHPSSAILSGPNIRHPSVSYIFCCRTNAQSAPALWEDNLLKSQNVKIMLRKTDAHTDSWNMQKSPMLLIRHHLNLPQKLVEFLESIKPWQRLPSLPVT